MSKNVVIVGGGYGGAQLARFLDKKKQLNVTLIEPRHAVIHKVGGPRAAVDDKFAEKCVIPIYDDQKKSLIMKRGQHIPAFAKNVDTEKSTVTWENSSGQSETVSYDYLVIATGAQNSRWVEPAGESTKDLVSNWVKGVEATKNPDVKEIKIIGGGTTGVECAGEIIDANPGKKVVLAHSRDKLMNNHFAGGIPDGWDKRQAKALNDLTNKGVDVQFNQSIDISKFDGTWNTHGYFIDSGVMYINSMGCRPNTNWLASSGLPLSENGCIKVNEFHQVDGNKFASIFALGDCADYAKEGSKLSIWAGVQAGDCMMPKGQGRVVADNIVAMAKGKGPCSKWNELPFNKQLALVPIGKKQPGCCGGVHGVTLNAPSFAIKIKAGDYFLGNVKAGVKPVK